MMTQTQDAFERLYQTIIRLRAPDGCPWDREQTPLSLRETLIEEAYETIEAITEAGEAGATVPSVETAATTTTPATADTPAIASTSATADTPAQPATSQAVGHVCEELGDVFLNATLI